VIFSRHRCIKTDPLRKNSIRSMVTRATLEDERWEVVMVAPKARPDFPEEWSSRERIQTDDG
jgi:hypothetical protein